MTNSLDGVRRGSQRPRIEHYPLFHTTAADDAVDLAAVANLELDEWQEYVLRGALGERQDGRWSAFRVALVAPRQNGKNAILEARELAGVLLFGDSVITHTAHEFKTSHNSMVALMKRIRGCELLDEVRGGAGMGADSDIRDIDGFKTGNQPSITMKNGNMIQFFARTGGSGRGFTGDLVVLDEAYALRLDQMAATLPTMAARSIEGNPQVWFTSSAGMPESDLLASVREEGIEGNTERLAYFEWSAPDDCAADDVDGWYEANPALGIRISEQYVRDEFAAMAAKTGSDEYFKRERLGIWARLGGEAVFPAGAWSALADDESTRGDRFVFVVEVAGNRESASIVAVSERADGLMHVEVVESREGTSWLGHRLRELQERHSPEGVWAIAGGHVDAMQADWRREGVRVRLVKFADYVNSCGVMYSLVVDGKIRHLDDPILNDAVEHVAQTWTRDRAAFYWSRKDSTVDITPLVAATVGVGVLQRRQGKPSGEKRKKAVIL